MALLPHYSQGKQKYFSEQRLAFRMSNPEVMGESQDAILAKLQEMDVETAAQQEVDQLMQDIEQREETIDSWKQRIDLLDLTPAERLAIAKNLERLAARAKVTLETRPDLAALREALSQQQTPQEQSETPAPREEATDKEQQSNEQPKEDKEKEQQEGGISKTEMVVAGGVIGAIVLGAALLFRKGKEKAKAGAEKTKGFVGGIMSKIGIALLTAGIVTTGVLGYKAVRKALEIKRAAKKIGAEIKKLEGQLAKATSPAERERLKRMIAEKKEQLGRVGQEERTEEEPEKDTETEKKQKVDPEIVESMQREAAGLMAGAFIRLHETPDWYAPDPVKKLHIRDFLHGNRDVKMATLFSGIPEMNTAPINDQTITIRETDRLSREHAARLVAKVCREQAVRMVKAGTPKDRVDRFTLDEFMQESAAGYAAVGRTFLQIENSGGDLAEAMKTMNAKSTILGDRGVQKEMVTIIEEHKDLLGEEEVSGTDLLKVALGKQISINEYLSGGLSTDDPRERLLQAVCEDIQKNTHAFILPFFHKILPHGYEWNDENMDKNLEHAKMILLDRMYLSQAVRLYLYQRLMKKGNAAGVILMQTEIFSYFAKNDDSFGSMDTAELGNNILGVAAGATWNEWDEVGASIDEDTLDEAWKTVGSLGKTGLKAITFTTVTALEKATGFVLGTIKSSKKLQAAVGIGGALYMGAKWHDYRANAMPEPTKLRLKSMFESRAALSETIKFNGILINKQAAAMAASNFGEIVFHAEELRTSGNLYKSIGEKLHRDLSKVTTPGLVNTQKVWDEFIKKVEGYRAEYAGKLKAAIASKDKAAQAAHKEVLRHLDEVLKRSRKIAANPYARTAVSWAAHPRVGRINSALRNAVKLRNLVRGYAIYHTGSEIWDYTVNQRPVLQRQYLRETNPEKKESIRREMRALETRLWTSGGGTVATLTPWFFQGGMAVIGAGELFHAAHSSVEEGTRYMMQSESDMRRYSRGDIYHQIERTKPGEYVTWGQGLAAVKNKDEMERQMYNANQEVRKNAYRAYFWQSAGSHLSWLDYAYLDEKTVVEGKLEEQQTRLLAINKEYVTVFVRAADQYISRKTDGQYTTVGTEDFLKAESFGRLAAAEFRAELLGQKVEKSILRQSSAKVDRAIKEEQEQRTEALVKMVGQMAEYDSNNYQEAVSRLLLNEVIHDVALQEHKMIQTLSGEQLAIARGALAAEIKTQLERAMREKRFNKSILNTYLNVLRSITGRNPKDIVASVTEEKKRRDYANIGSQAGLLSIGGLVSIVQYQM